jgi:hypothetical protein
MVARALFIVHNCMYDAWAAYDRTAVGTVFGRLFIDQDGSEPLRTKTKPSASRPTARQWTYFPTTKAQCSIL